MIRRLGVALAWASAGGIGLAAAAAPDCARLDPARTLAFGTATVREQPAFADPRAALVEAQLARGACRAAADATIDAMLQAAPDAAVPMLLDAHRDLLDGDRAVAERKLRAALAADAALAPARVLLAQALLEREQRDEASALLAAADAAAPGDLRTAMLRLRLEALAKPHGEGPLRLQRLVRDERLTPELREMAQTTVLYATALKFPEKEAALRDALAFESQTPMWRKRLALGRFLAEDAGKAAAAREALQAVVDGEAPADGKADARVLLAETWLMDAAAIAPSPGAANSAQVARARELVGGNLLPVAMRIRQSHDLSRLEPFVAGVRDPDARDAQHLTALCRATQALDAAAVQAALDAGAAVDGECAGATALAFVVRAGPADFARKRAVAEVLLARGADPDPKLYPGSTYTARSFCADNYPQCRAELLPLLDRAQAVRAAPPAQVAPPPAR